MTGSQTRTTVLARLRDSSGYVSGQELAAELHITRPAVWKHIEALRAEGYEIDAVPRLGYRLISSPDLLVPEEVLGRLGTRLVGARIVHFDNVASTNDKAKELAAQGEPEGTVVIAETQGSGRGRLGRAWLSPAGGIYLTVILRPAMPPSELAKVTLTAAVSTGAAIRETTGVPVTIKWPNDILAGGRKVVGILTEMTAEADVVTFVVVGIGVNANTRATDYPADVRRRVTSLAAAGGRPVDRVELCVSILQHLDRDWSRVIGGEFGAVLGDWRDMSSTLGQRVRVSSVAGDVEGVAARVTGRGELVVVDDAGVERLFSSGEVEHLRLA